MATRARHDDKPETYNVNKVIEDLMVIKISNVNAMSLCLYACTTDA